MSKTSKIKSFRTQTEWEQHVNSLIKSEDAYDAYTADASDEISLAGRDEIDPNALLRTLDEDDTVDGDVIATVSAEIKTGPSPQLMSAIAKKITQIEIDRAANKEDFYSKKRAQDRRDYAHKKAADGKTVRTYKSRKDRFILGESDAERKSRLNREDMRAKNGKDETSVRAWESLADLTEDELATRNREKAAKRKRLQREREKKEKSAK